MADSKENYLIRLDLGSKEVKLKPVLVIPYWLSVKLGSTCMEKTFIIQKLHVVFCHSGYHFREESNYWHYNIAQIKERDALRSFQGFLGNISRSFHEKMIKNQV